MYLVKKTSCEALHYAVFSILLLLPNILCTLLSNTQKTGNILVLYIVIFKFLEGRWDGERFQTVW
jgi:hypothetical protein